jgi:hypothetical protein
MESRTSRYQSRILREMHQNKENPFNSPPSSTGSHGTITATSDLSFHPEGESTRRMEDSIVLPTLSNRHASRNAAQTTPFKVNTSAIGRNFPEWKDWDGNDQTDDIYNTTGDHETHRKENIPPSSSTVNSPSQIEARKAADHGARTSMHARVDDESDYSGTMDLGHSAHRQPSSGKKRSQWKSYKGNVTSLINTLKAAQATKDVTTPKSSPKPTSAELRSSINRQSRKSHIHLDPATPNHNTTRSFFLPNLEHIKDFVSGALRLSTVRNGIPVFVKHGKVLDRGASLGPEDHTEVDAIEIPQDEQEIFVSLDKIREEIQALQEHDDQVSKQAEELQEVIYELQIQLSRYKSRKDSAMGSDSESSMVEYLNSQKSHLEEKVVSLQAKLDKANRKISINEIHTESYVAERDEALKGATEQLEKISSLQAELDAARNEARAARRESYGAGAGDEEAKSLRDENITLRSQYKTLLEDNQSLRSHNNTVTKQNTELQQEIKRLHRLLDNTQEDQELMQKEFDGATEDRQALREDNMSLERQNDKLYTENKSLQQKVALLERRVRDLQENNAQLHQMLDAANAESGTMTLDTKDFKDRLEKRNSSLSDENAQLLQDVSDLKKEFNSKKIGFEQEKRRLGAEIERLQATIDSISGQFEEIIQEVKREAERNREDRQVMTQRIGEIASREATLATNMRFHIDSDYAQQHTPRKNNAGEARPVHKEARIVQTSGGKPKPVKVTRILEPVTSRSRSTLSDVSARSTTEQLDTQARDDFTQQIDLTQGSDFDVLPNAELEELREALRRAKSDAQNLTEEYLDFDPEDMSQSLPPPFVPESQRSTVKSIGTVTPQRKPSGILKNARAPEQDLSGRFSVKSAMSPMGIPSPNRRHSDSVRFEIDAEENMTSALFMDDITIDARKRAAEKSREKEAPKVKFESKKPIRTLSADAKRVLDGLCDDHDCRNCIMCVRINSHLHEDDALFTSGKKTVTIKQPVPVTDRIANPVAGSEADHTMRPAQEPGLALASVIKSMEDEAAHISSTLSRKQAQYATMDASYGKRERKQLSAEISRLMRILDMKKDQIYRLYDVLEGQKQHGQQMSDAEVEITISSILALDDTWDGFMD